MFRLFAAIISSLGLVAVAVAQTPTPVKLADAEITKLMVGKWENTSKFGDITIRTVEHFKADGTVDREDTVNNQKITVKAKWEIKQGVLTTVVTESNGPVGKGTSVRGTVVAIDDKTQRLEMEAGATIDKTRLPN